MSPPVQSNIFSITGDINRPKRSGRRRGCLHELRDDGMNRPAAQTPALGLEHRANEEWVTLELERPRLALVLGRKAERGSIKESAILLGEPVAAVVLFGEIGLVADGCETSSRENAYRSTRLDERAAERTDQQHR